jgi:hypothetical protein
MNWVRKLPLWVLRGLASWLLFMIIAGTLLIHFHFPSVVGGVNEIYAMSRSGLMAVNDVIGDLKRECLDSVWLNKALHASKLIFAILALGFVIRESMRVANLEWRAFRQELRKRHNNPKVRRKAWVTGSLSLTFTLILCVGAVANVICEMSASGHGIVA